MLIGFSQRRQTVSESMAEEGSDEFLLILNVTSLRRSEQEYVAIFRHQESSSTAMVEATNAQFSTVFDARFGTRFVADEPIQEQRILVAGQLELQSDLPVFIINDFRPEDEECFTIRILSPDVEGLREVFVCNEVDDLTATDHFCTHTICIQDDDGKW